MKTIPCQANHENKGCHICGGYKEVLCEVELICGHKYWARPGAHTFYIGKKFTSFDGLEIICLKDGFSCVTCFKEEKNA